MTTNLLIGLLADVVDDADAAAMHFQQSFGFEALSFSEGWLRLRDLASDGVSAGRGVVVGPLRCENDVLWLQGCGGAVVHVRREGAVDERGLTVKPDVVLVRGGCLDEFYKKLDDMVVAMVDVDGGA